MPSSDVGIAPVEQRPVQVMLFAFDGFGDTATRQRDGWKGLRKFAARLNAHQDLFEFKANEPELTLDTGSEELLHAFSATHYYDCLSKQLAMYADVECAIGLTHRPLEKNEFNHHDQNRGVGVITIESYQLYIPESGSLVRYLSYLAFCESFCLAGRQQYEHREHWKCLFDLCGDKPELEDCLRYPHICGRCKQRLAKSGFGEAGVTGVEAFLQRSSKPVIGSSLGAALRRPAVSILVGALIAAAAGAFRAEHEGALAWAPALTLGVVFSVCVFWEYLSTKLDRRSVAGPRSRWNWLGAPKRWAAAILR